MKYLGLILIFSVTFSLYAIQGQQTFTDQDQDRSFVRHDEVAASINSNDDVNTADNRLGINWQTSDISAIANKVCVSSETGNTIVEWLLNNERFSLFHDTSIPVWEHQIGDIDFDMAMDMLEDGSMMAIGDENTLKVFTPASSIPVWDLYMSSSIDDLVLQPGGTGIYVTSNDEVNNVCYLEYYNLGVEEPVWSISYPGYCQTLDMSGDGSTLILTQYGEYDNMFVISSEDGSQIFQGPEYNQYPPSISFDASIIVNGDYSGYMFVYEYNSELGTYEEAWSFSAGGDSWVVGMAVSGDGSTIAIGTLKFLTGAFDGEIYLFNRNSSTPVWIFENAGDEVIDIDISYDGSLIAAASYGPLDHSTADFFLFRRNSNVPVLEVNTAGSFFSVDISDDGSICAVSGKAVHAREMGNGGMLYNIDCDLGGGSITGVINLENTDENSGVKVSVNELVDYFDYTDSEGNFLIENIPSDIYSVSYEKVGYLANNSMDVIVFEGDVTDLGEIPMYLTGNPPEELTATQAYDVFVTLSWDPPEGNPEGYNVYRKTNPVDFYPEEPFAVIDPAQNSWQDHSAQPFIDYYYVVTAVLPGGMQSPYSNEATGWISTGFVANGIEAYVGLDPVIDGSISYGEWDDAFYMDVSDFWGTYDNVPNPIGSCQAFFKVNLELNKLYCAFINYNDGILEDHDEVALYIDDNNDGVYSPETEANEGNYWAAYYAAGNELKYRPIYDTGGVGTVFYLPDPELEVTCDGASITYEFAIPIGDEPWMINPGAENMSSLSLFVLDDNTPEPHGFDGFWPYDNTNLFHPALYKPITYNAVLQTPPAPEDLDLTDNNDDGTLTLSWLQPEINDFDHFNIYLSIEYGDLNIIAETVGVGYIYEIEYYPETNYQFFVTTVNHQDLESDPSNLVEFDSVDSEDDLPELKTELYGNYPNPFNPTTTISFSLALEDVGNVKLEIFNIKGQKVRTLVDTSTPLSVIADDKHYDVTWNGKDEADKAVSSGLYFYRLKAGKKDLTRKMILLK